jgi:hypothetical protein
VDTNERSKGFFGEHHYNNNYKIIIIIILILIITAGLSGKEPTA